MRAQTSSLLYDPSQTVTRGGGAETLTVGTGSDPLTYHAIETIDATTSGGEQFIFSAGFGKETINGFSASGASPDSIQLATSAFSYLTPGMTQAQDLAAVLSHATNGASGLTITDTDGDSLTLTGVTAAMIAANPAMFNSPEFEPADRASRRRSGFAAALYARRRRSGANGQATRRVAAHPPERGEAAGRQSAERQGLGGFVIVERAARDLRVEVGRDDIKAHERTGRVHGLDLLVETPVAIDRLGHVFAALARQGVANCPRAASKPRRASGSGAEPRRRTRPRSG